MHDLSKLGDRTTGSYKILQVNTNGTITIELRPEVTEQINIRRVIPYHEDEN